MVYQEGDRLGRGLGLRSAAREGRIVVKAVFKREVAHREAVGENEGIALGLQHGRPEADIQFKQLRLVHFAVDKIISAAAFVHSTELVGDLFHYFHRVQRRGPYVLVKLRLIMLMLMLVAVC